MRECPNCGELNGDNNSHCYKCNTFIGPVSPGKKRCPKCDISYPSGKSYCDVCGGSLLNSSPTPSTSAASNLSLSVAKNNNKKLFIIAVIIAVVLVFLIVSCQGGGHVGSRKVKAWTCAQTIVKDNLKSPSSAEFCSINDATIENSGDKYTISGYVDADNSFGASIRSEFTVTFILTDNGCTNVRCHID